MYTYVYVTTKEKEAISLKENRSGIREGLGGRKGKGK